MPSYIQRKTLMESNQFRFVCPVFHVEVGIATCFKLREKVWRGEKVPVRKGCQVALHASKCPIPAILHNMMRDHNDPYASDTVVVGTLAPEILDRIAPVLIPEKAIASGGCNEVEIRHLEAANADARAGVRPKRSTKTAPARTKVFEEPVKEASTPAKSQLRAPEQDMAALVNAIVSDEGKEASA